MFLAHTILRLSTWVTSIEIIKIDYIYNFS